MTLDDALRATEVLLALAVIQHSAEHLVGPRKDRMIFAARIGVAALLAAGFSWAIWGLMALALVLLGRFDGPYNGGSDKMSLLITACLCLAAAAPEMGLGYLAIQLVLSYFVSGWVKLRNPDWRSGQALRDVFAFSAYPASEGFRAWSGRPRVLFAAGWAVILFEVVFPLALLDGRFLMAALVIGSAFHLANGVLFGLNRFVWSWLAAYPSLLWFQNWVVG